MHATSLPSRSTTLLVVAADYDDSAEAELLAHASEYDRTLVVAPASPPPDAEWIVDDDDAACRAHRRAERVAAYLRTRGLAVDDEVGDPDPLLAAADAIALHPVDGVVILADDDRSGRRLARRSSRLARPTDVIALHGAAAVQQPPHLDAAL